MTPTMIGRIQTRIFLVLVIGVPWTLIVSNFLPNTDGASLSTVYRATFTALAVVLVVGLVVWEPIYQALQQYRWERDWPSVFALVTVVNEGIVAYFITKAIGPLPGDADIPVSTFIVHILTTWVLMWLFVVGPIRVIFPRYRFRGGRILGGF
jgi:hypothetical protein